MNNLALPVQEVQADERVQRDLPYERERHALEVVLADDGEHVGPHRLEHHAHMRPIRSVVREIIDQLHHASKALSAWDALVL